MGKKASSVEHISTRKDTKYTDIKA
jgi:hypothetical protein